MATNMGSCYAKEKVEVERSTYEWTILDFNEVFQVFKKPKKAARLGNRRNRSNGKQVDSSEMELVSETFMRGQLVQRTSIWQIELRRNGVFLCVGLSCLQCFHESVDEIWTRFDIDIVDLKGDVCYSQSAGTHFCSDNVTRFIPTPKLGERKKESQNIRCSFWETDVIALSDLMKNWNKLIHMNLLNLRLRMYIYHDKPLDEASHLAEYREPVQLCYTDNFLASLSKHPFLVGVRNLWQSMQDSDVIFLVKGEQIKAHKFVVSVQSPVLKSTVLQHKDQDAPIPLEVASVEAFQQMLQYLYTQECTDLKICTDINYLTNVLDTCNQFEIYPLARICLVRLLTNMKIENFGETAFTVFSRVTQEHSYFKTEVKNFFMENQKDLQKSESFQRIAREKMDLFLQLSFEPLKILQITQSAQTG